MSRQWPRSSAHTDPHSQPSHAPALALDRAPHLSPQFCRWSKERADSTYEFLLSLTL